MPVNFAVLFGLQNKRHAAMKGFTVHDLWGVYRMNRKMGENFCEMPVCSVSQKKTSSFYFLNNCQKLADFNNFWDVKS